MCKCVCFMIITDDIATILYIRIQRHFWILRHMWCQYIVAAIEVYPILLIQSKAIIKWRFCSSNIEYLHVKKIKFLTYPVPIIKYTLIRWFNLMWSDWTGFMVSSDVNDNVSFPWIDCSLNGRWDILNSQTRASKLSVDDLEVMRQLSDRDEWKWLSSRLTKNQMNSPLFVDYGRRHCSITWWLPVSNKSPASLNLQSFCLSAILTVIFRCRIDVR
jgi:hypothetical protein